MTRIFTDIEQWLGQRYKWLQDAASRVIQNNNTLSDTDFQELIELCKAEALLIDSDKEFKKVVPNSLSVNDTTAQLRLEALHSVKGISALGPRNPLTFSKPLSIVYGQNGAGKSSYVRLLKHISGAKKSGKLMPNVYVNDQQTQECSLIINSNENKSEIVWTPEMGTLSKLSTLQLYDTDCANVYVNEENEVTYEPWILQLFSQLANTCVKVGQAIKQEKDTISLTTLKPPLVMSKTESILWLNKISALTSKDDIDTYCSWGEADELELNNKKQQIAERDPIEKVKRLRITANSFENVHSLLNGVKNSLSEETCAEIIDAKLDYISKKKAADEDAKKIFDGLPLEGVGTESWKLLWEQARLYSEQHAYPIDSFPYTSSDSNCILCQQPLSKEAQARMDSFESYVKDSLNKQAKVAEEHLNSKLKYIQDIPNDSIFELHFNSMGITILDEKKKIIDFSTALQLRADSVKKATSLEQLTPLPSEEILIALSEAATAKAEQATSYETLSKTDSRVKLENEIIELEAREWLYQNKVVISENVEKLKLIMKYNKAYSLTNTQALSTKKSSLSDELITTEYIKRFEKELKELGASKINVNLVKTKTEKGHIYHQIKLKNSTSNVLTSEVLSEGEFRIVSLAGFLADVEGRKDNTPFIFDDPISSLDQYFEELTIKRIAKLSLSRQVIVFTHRLSLVTLLEDVSKDIGVETNVTWLHKEPWGAGEPGEIPIYAKKPDKALKSLQNERLSKARKVLHEKGKSEYDILAKGICSDFRILLERFIENDLLGDVVQRFRRSVNTMGKIEKLAKISTIDTDMFDELMTKYSRYEHSHSFETPIMLPEPDELNEDMERIICWLTEFKKR